MKKLLILFVILLLSISSATGVFAQSFKDTKNHWAKNEINRWSDRGVIKGYNGKFNPDDPVTRAEMAAIINSIFKYHLVAQNSFVDLPDEWYKEAILKNNKKGIILGYNKKVRPLDNITHQEVAIMLSNAFNIKKSDEKANFSDYNEVADWSAKYVNGMYKLGYISPNSDGKFLPNQNATRAEIIKIIDNIVSAYYQNSGVYSQNVDGTVIVNTPDVILKDMNIKGDLIVAEGVMNGDLTLDSVNLTGKMYVYGGGEQSINIINSSVDDIVLAKQEGRVRLNSVGNFQTVHVMNDSHAILDGNFIADNIDVFDTSSIYIHEDIVANSLSFKGERANAVIDGDIKNVNLSPKTQKTDITGIGGVQNVIAKNSELNTTAFDSMKSSFNLANFEKKKNNIKNENSKTSILLNSKINKKIQKAKQKENSNKNLSSNKNNTDRKSTIKSGGSGGSSGGSNHSGGSSSSNSNSNSSGDSSNTNNTDSSNNSNNENSSNGSDNSNDENSNNTNEDKNKNKYEYTIVDSFIGSPTKDIKVYNNDKIVKGYKLYVDDKLVATDLNNSGTVKAISTYFKTNSIVKYSVENSEKYTLIKK